MKKVMTILVAALFLGACHCTKCTKKSCQKAPVAPAPVVVVAPKPLPPAPKPQPKVEANDFKEVAVVNQQAENKVVLNFKDPINFAYNSDVISEDSLESIQKVANVLKKYPNATVHCVGYTDSLGNADYNVDLSQRRAKAVEMQLVKDGVKAGNVTSEGRGAANPIATNKTAAGRAQNRRVELEVTNK